VAHGPELVAMRNWTGFFLLEVSTGLSSGHWLKRTFERARGRRLACSLLFSV
jgi:hypothetical protein